jgi:hypothetical protein
LNCEDVIESIVLTIGDDVISWPVGQSIAEMVGCEILLRHCTEPVVWDLLDYSAVTAWDGRNGNCWKPFADLGGAEGDLDWPYLGCCDPSPAPEGGGGGGPMMMTMNGPTPVTPQDCIPCGASYEQGDYACQPTEYYISTFKIHDVTATIKIKTWYEYVAHLKFKGPAPFTIGPQWRITKTLYADIQHKVQLSITGYYNDYCPRNEECVVEAADCDEAVSGIAPDQVFGNYWCETATVGSGGLKDSRYFNCALDTPNWEEITTSTYCFDSLMKTDGTWQAGCDQMITPCTGEIVDIDGRLGVIVDSDEDWATARSGNSTCWIINATSRAWEVANSFGDWITYALSQRGAIAPSTQPGMPFDNLMDNADWYRSCNIRLPQVPTQTDCVDGCREFILGRSTFQQIGGDGTVQNEGYPAEEAGDYTCGVLTGFDYYWVYGGTEIGDDNGDIPDVVFDFSECPVTDCSNGSTDPNAPPVSPPQPCDFYHPDCCEGTTPTTVTIPVGWDELVGCRLSFIYA